MVALSDFCGFCSSNCALARALAIAPMVSLERCMCGLRKQVKTDCAGFGAPGPHPVPDGLLGIVRHQFLKLGSRGVMIEIRGAGPAEDACQFRPRIGGAHVNQSHRLNLWPGRLDAKEVRGLSR